MLRGAKAIRLTGLARFYNIASDVDMQAKLSRKGPSGMEICGVIAEYNPFHSGHRYQLAAARAASGAGGIVCVMSTSFTQRGEPALLPAHTRARMALEGGADLVIALPLPFAMAGAERFARGGVALLAAAGCTHLAFGCESADPDALEQTARYLLSADFSRDLKPHLAGGSGFARAREQAVTRALGASHAALLTRPNDLLAVEYCKAIQALGVRMALHPIRRVGAGHDTMHPEGAYASASYLRGKILQGALEDTAPYLPDTALPLLQAAEARGEIARPERLERVILDRLRSMAPDDWDRIPDLSEGLGNRLCRLARTAHSLDALLTQATTRRHPTARIRRAVMHAVMGTDRSQLPALPPYLHILGMTKGGRALLSAASIPLPVGTSLAKLAPISPHTEAVARLEGRAADLRALACDPIGPCGSIYTTHPILL